MPCSLREAARLLVWAACQIVLAINGDFSDTGPYLPKFIHYPGSAMKARQLGKEGSKFCLQFNPP